MNCIILLLLLSCCGSGNGSCGNDCGCRGTGHGNRTDCGCGGMNHRKHHDAGCGRRTDPCCCEPARPCPEPCCCEPERPRPEPCCCEPERPRPQPDCGCAREERECDAPSSGMIPPPWQDYPRFPRRDKGDDCGCES